MQLTILGLCILLVTQTVWGIHLPFERDNDPFKSVSFKPSHVVKSYGAFLSSNENFNNGDLSNRMEDRSTEYSQVNDTTLQTEESNYTVSTNNQSVSSAYFTTFNSNTSDNQNVENSTTVVGNQSHSQNSTEFSPSESSATTNEGTISGTKSSTLTIPSNNETDATSLTTVDDEPEGVARGKPSTTESVNTTTTHPKTLYQRGLALISDPYTLSILVPIAAGVMFATTIILTIATCRCIRRRCIRRRLRRKALPDSVKNLRPSDRARLLAESSDEEF